VTISRDPLDGVDGTTSVANPYTYVLNDPLNRVDPLGLRAGDIQFDNCHKIEGNRCPVVIDDISATARAGIEPYDIPSRRNNECYVATDSAGDVFSASRAIGIDTRLVFGVYLQETTGCRDPARDGILANLGRLGSAGASNLPGSSFEATVRRNPQRFGFASASDVGSTWLADRFRVPWEVGLWKRAGCGTTSSSTASLSTT